MPEESLENRARHRMMKVGAILAPVLLITIAIFHAFLPKRLTLDWETVVLLLVGILLTFLPMRELAAMIKSLQLGEVKILLNESKDLGKSTEEAEREIAEAAEEPPTEVGSRDEGPEVSQGSDDEHIDDDEDGDSDPVIPHRPTRKPHSGEPRHRPTPDSDSAPIEQSDSIGSSGIVPLWRVMGEIGQIAAASPRAALLRLASVIESAVVIVAEQTRVIQPTGLTLFRQAITGLVASRIFPSSLGESLLKFMSIRNRIAHERMDGVLEDDLVRTTINDGLALYRLVLIVAQSKIENLNPYDGETISLI